MKNDYINNIIESADWGSIDMKVKVNESTEDVETNDEVIDESDDDLFGFVEDEDGDMFFVAEDQIFECLLDEDGDLYLVDEDGDLFEAYEDDDEIVLEAIDPEDFELLDEKTSDEDVEDENK